MINKMPPRTAFDFQTLDAVKEVFFHYREKKIDFGYQGDYEKQYTNAFVSFMGNQGYADAMSSGTASIFVALASLQLKPGAHVIVSSITDPGTISAIILNRLVPVLADNSPGSYNIGVPEFDQRVSKETKAAVVVHAAGKAAPIKEICEISDRRGIPVIEDCSQAHGAQSNGTKVGCFGEVAAFSTMHRKAHSTGGCGGVAFTQSKERYDLLRAYADRGKPFSSKTFDEKDPGCFLFPALNFNIDELSCAIGIRSLLNLQETIRKRLAFLLLLKNKLEKVSKVCRITQLSEEDSPFFQPITVDESVITCNKKDFAKTLQSKGIPVNPDYRYVVCEWPWVRTYLSDDFLCRNAIDARNKTFNLLLNENYGYEEVEYILEAISETERAVIR
jgi:dTDP-4-amino-4,6-dideoxygalactose transaminase